MCAVIAPKPVNVLPGPNDGLVAVQTRVKAGMRRVYIGAAFARTAYGSLLQASHLLRNGDLPTAPAGIRPCAIIQALMG